MIRVQVLLVLIPSPSSSFQRGNANANANSRLTTPTKPGPDMFAEDSAAESRAIEPTEVVNASDGSFSAGGATAPGDKVNQDMLILDVVPGGARASAPGPPAVHVVGCVDGHGDRGRRAAAYIRDVSVFSSARAQNL